MKAHINLLFPLMAKTVIFMAALYLPVMASAQKDTSRKPSVDIVSSYKPVLRSAVKINFSGSQLPADTNRSVRDYNVPSQNLIYAYQPVTLKPLALDMDSNLYLGNRNYIKAGFGSYNTPYVKVGLGAGDGKKSLVNLYGLYTSSKGSIKNQDYSELSVRGTGSYFMKDNELYADASVNQKVYHLYGYDHSLFDYKKSEVRRAFQEVNIQAGLRNTATLPLGFAYNPSLRFNIFNVRDRLTETSVMFDLPLELNINEQFSAKVSLKGDFTNYSSSNMPVNIKFSNNLVQLTPEIVYRSPRFTIHGGVTPVWDNGNYKLLPNIYAEGQLQEKVFLVQAGWVGRVTKNTFRNLSAINPYIADLAVQQNTRELELYGGIKASIGKHFNVSAKASLLSYTDLPLFINDTSSLENNKQFLVSNESKINNFRIHADMSFISQDKFSLTAGVNLNAYTNMVDNARAWNTLPFELTGSFRWWAFDRVLLKSDLYIFGGGKYPDFGNITRTFAGGTDLNIGGEFRINRQFNAFLDVNNIFANKYQRWHNYEVYGLNLLGGIIVKF